MISFFVYFCLKEVLIHTRGTDAAAIPDECSVCVCPAQLYVSTQSTFHVMTSLGLVQLPHEWSSLS